MPNNATLFANPACIRSWRAEARRIERKELITKHTKYVQDALAYLDELYCLQNPQQKNPLHMRQGAFALFVEASSAGYPLAMFFEGLARKEGFGCNKDVATGQALIQVAGMRKCPEAMNYLALCAIAHDLLGAMTMLRDAAMDGHVQALSNFRVLAENVRIQLRRRRQLVEFAANPQRMRFSH